MFEYPGSCQCKKVTLSFYCPKPLHQYQARACDCDYCLAKGIEYLSDPKGKLTIAGKDYLEEQKQGTRKAVFLVCSNCQTTIAACFSDKKRDLGSVNATLLTHNANLQKSITVSPKMLNKDEKIKRWQALWGAVEIT